MRRITARTGQYSLDLLVIIGAFFVAFLVRFDGDLPHQMFKRSIFLLPYVVILKAGALVYFGVHNFAWRYVGLKEVQRIASATLSATSVLVVLRFLSAALRDQIPQLQYGIVPLGVIAIDALLMFLGITGVRVVRRLLVERASRHHYQQSRPDTETSRILLVGAGSAGVQVARQISQRPDMGMNAMGFIDEALVKQGQVLHGVKVLGTMDDLPGVVEQYEIDEVVITIANASRTEIRRILSFCDPLSVNTKIIPGLHEILDGRVELSRIRQVSIDDLLGRDTVSLDMEIAGPFVAGRRLLVTGAGGSIGSELCRQLARLKPETLVLVERAEPSLFMIDRELRQLHPNLHLVAAVCDVCDGERVDDLFATHRPHVVFHAAAHKHVPLMEDNPGEAIKNNIFGTQTVARAADKHAAGSFVMVSTDKAVNPTSVMGATKRVAELIVQDLAKTSSTRYVAVRFGNVLGSAGSVIPIFKEQIAQGGPVTVTHPEMRRYFMTIPEASQLVVQAGALGRGGEIFVLDMGEPVRIVDLAKDLIHLSGLEPGTDIKIEFNGIRPGEKLFEELSFHRENMEKTRHPKIFIGQLAPLPGAQISDGLASLHGLRSASSRADVLGALRALVPELQEPAESTQPSKTVYEPESETGT